MRPAQRQPAFSLLELIIVVAIVAMLATMALPRFSNATARYRADAAATRIVADLSLAQRQAKLSSASQKVEFDVTDDSYHLVGLQHLDHPDQDYVVALADEPYQAVIISADFNGRADVTFDTYGVPDSGGAIVVQVGTEQRKIAVDADTGKASVQ